MKIELLAAGRLRKGAHFDLFEDYRKRLSWTFIHTEIEARNTAEEQRAIGERISPSAYVIALDERGKSLSSRELSQKISELGLYGRSHLQFVIGGADGLGDDLRARADLLLSFGRLTWPHMLARVMLLEQIYRCQQIQAQHPYHRD